MLDVTSSCMFAELCEQPSCHLPIKQTQQHHLTNPSPGPDSWNLRLECIFSQFTLPVSVMLCSCPSRTGGWSGAAVMVVWIVCPCCCLMSGCTSFCLQCNSDEEGLCSGGALSLESTSGTASKLTASNVTFKECSAVFEAGAVSLKDSDAHLQSVIGTGCTAAGVR
jgi:hypothetical protein